ILSRLLCSSPMPSHRRPSRVALLHLPRSPRPPPSFPTRRSSDLVMVAMPLLPGAVPLPAPVHLYALVLRTLWEGSDIRPGSPDTGMTRAWGGVRLLQWCDVPSPAPIRPPLREPGAARDPHPDLDRVRPPQPGERRLGAAGHQ